MTSSFSVPSPSVDLLKRALDARDASMALSQTTDKQRRAALISMTEALKSREKDIVQANNEDLERAVSEGLGQALVSRLKLDQNKLNGAIDGVCKVAQLDDPIGIRQLHRKLDHKLILERLTVPLGLLGVIFEARPDAMIQIASLAIRSGNGALLKGGSEASLTNKAIMHALKIGLDASTVDSYSLELLTTRQESMALLKLDGIVDLIIPRGSNDLVKFIQDNTRIPVLGHADGICHLYVDSEVDIEQALKIAIDSKVQYPAACNSIETLLVHKDIAESFLGLALPKLSELGVYLLGDHTSLSFGIENIATDDDWKTEYLDLKLSIKVVNNIDEALTHIRQYGSRHTECIATNNHITANKFLKAVDSAGVYHNCSTRFADGFRYGFGAEVGISTQTLPPRGPVGLEGLVTYRYILRGDGHVAGDYASGKRDFTFEDLEQ